MKARLHKTILMNGILLVTLLVPHGALFTMDEKPLDRWREFSKKTECRMLMSWLRCVADERLTRTTGCRAPGIETPPFFGSLGIFITLKKGSRIRGCYGAFSHAMTDLQRLLSDYLTGALTRDLRHTPLDAAELADTDIILTVATMPYPVSDAGAIDMQHHGVMLVCNGDETMVFVPAEVRTTSYVERLIKGKSCQVSAFRAITIR